MIENLKIIKAQLENEQIVSSQISKTTKNNVSAPKQNNIKQKNKVKSVSNFEPGWYFVVYNIIVNKLNYRS